MTSGNVRKHRFVLCNDGGTLVGPTRDAPMGEDGLVELTIKPLIGTQIDTLYWQLGTDVADGYPSHRLSDVYSHRTAVGPILGQDTEVFETAGLWRVHRNTNELFERGTDPPAVVIKHGHYAGLDVFLSLRMNDTHDCTLGRIDHPMVSRMKRKHPEWLLPSFENDGGNAFGRLAYNYLVAEVREYKLALIRAYWRAEHEGNLDGVMRHYCRDAEFVTPGGAVVGSEAIRTAYAGSFETYREIRVTIVNAIEQGDELAVEYSLDLTWPDGRHRTMRGCNVFTFAGDLFISVRCYFDSAAFI